MYYQLCTVADLRSCMALWVHRIVFLFFISVIGSFYLSALFCPLSVSLWPSCSLVYLPSLLVPYLLCYLFILSVPFCPCPGLPVWFECLGVPFTCLLTCRCVSRRLRGLASGSLSQAGGITLTFRAGRRPSSYLMCWREARPRACCSKSLLWPALPWQCLFNSSFIEFEMNLIHLDKIEWNSMSVTWLLKV